MPKRTDLKSILIIGAGPIVIGQACEFDYSGTQACKALKEEGYRVVLVNSNPATIMTDPEFADVTYIEPLTVEILEKIIAAERPSALLPTLGGQTALNLSMELHQQGILAKYQVEMIGAKPAAIAKGEDRGLFKEAMLKIGLDVAKSRTVHKIEEARTAAEELGAFPLIIRPSFTLGGSGGGIAYNREEFERIVANGLDISPVHEVLVEECLLGWKEFEMEVMRDHKDQCVVICSIENFDPMGVHTGDSITVAPAMTLTDKEFQVMRDASFAVIREIGVETGGSNIQFAVDPQTGRMVVIEMNPRVSRSSALASKATGFPIAKIAAKLAVGYTLDELQNDITRLTPASFEPTIDYVVTKIPRFTFEKFPDADPMLTSAMKSVGEAMAIGRTFKESIQKALRSLEIGARGFGGGGRLSGDEKPDDTVIKTKLGTPNAERIFYIRHAFRAGYTVQQIFDLTKIDPWFLHQLREIHEMEEALRDQALAGVETALFRRAKQFGFSDAQLAHLFKSDLVAVRAERARRGIKTTYRLVDTCAAEFEAFTPYYYSSYGDESEVIPSKKRKIMILGGGPNRIGQGIEFDYCCVHAAQSFRAQGFESVIVNCNPETVSTDYDTSDRLYFEPLDEEAVLAVLRRERPVGVCIQFGGQTPLKLARAIERAGFRILGTPFDAVDLAEDRERFGRLAASIGVRCPEWGIASNGEEAATIADGIGYPVLVRPSYVLGGRAMRVCYSESEVVEAMAAVEGAVLVDRFLEDAIELDVDALCDGTDTYVAAVMEHIEEAGIHSGDSSCVLPAPSDDERVRDAVRRLGPALGVIGLLNVQLAIAGGEVYVLEVNPRASRTVPFASKAIGINLVDAACHLAAGAPLASLGLPPEFTGNASGFHVKAAVLPFARFPGADPVLGPEMRSTGEVMASAADFATAFAKAERAAGRTLPSGGRAFLTVRDADKVAVVPLARSLVEIGFELLATAGTARVLAAAGIDVVDVDKGTPVLELVRGRKIDLVVNTPEGGNARRDGYAIREAAVVARVPCITTLAGARAAVEAMANARAEGPVSLQERHAAEQEVWRAVS